MSGEREEEERISNNQVNVKTLYGTRKEIQSTWLNFQPCRPKYISLQTI